MPHLKEVLACLTPLAQTYQAEDYLKRLGTICALDTQPDSSTADGHKLPFMNADDSCSVTPAHLKLPLAVCWAASSSCALAAVFFSSSTASWAWFSSCCSWACTSRRLPTLRS